jgi:hypothetical protein
MPGPADGREGCVEHPVEASIQQHRRGDADEHRHIARLPEEERYADRQEEVVNAPNVAN